MIYALLPIAIASIVSLSNPVSFPQQAYAQTTYFSMQVPLGYSLYKVLADDTIYTIAQGFYGDSSFWTTVWNDNDTIQNPNELKLNSTLKIRLNPSDTPDTLKPKLQEKLKKIVAQSHTSLSISQPSVVHASQDYPTSPFDDVYKKAGEKYGVPWQILYGIHLTETTLRDGAIFNAEGSGAQGPMQFMPDTWKAYAVDGNGDGKADINNAVDAIYTAANYLAQHGSIMSGLYSYGGNTQGILNAAASRGYSL